MAKVTERTWTVPGQRTKRRAWGYVAVEAGKHRADCADATCRGCQQVRVFKSEWSKDDAQQALSKYLLKIEQPRQKVGGMTFAQACATSRRSRASARSQTKSGS